MPLEKIMTDKELTSYYICPTHEVLADDCDHCILSETDFERAQLATKLLAEKPMFGDQSQIDRMRQLSELTVCVNEAKKSFDVKEQDKIEAEDTPSMFTPAGGRPSPRK